MFIPPFSSIGSAIKLQDIKTEPPSIFLGHPFGSMSNESRQGLVSVAITLRPAAAEVGMPLCLVQISHFIPTQLAF